MKDTYILLCCQDKFFINHSPFFYPVFYILFIYRIYFDLCNLIHTAKKITQRKPLKYPSKSYGKPFPELLIQQ